MSGECAHIIGVGNAHGDWFATIGQNRKLNVLPRIKTIDKQLQTQTAEFNKAFNYAEWAGSLFK